MSKPGNKRTSQIDKTRGSSTLDLFFKGKRSRLSDDVDADLQTSLEEPEEVYSVTVKCVQPNKSFI